MNNIQLTVKPENKKAFEAKALEWHRLVKVIGWKDLSKMYVAHIAPFQDAKDLKGSYKQKLKQAKQILINEMVCQLREAGLEVVK